MRAWLARAGGPLALFWGLVLAGVPALWLWGILTTPLATHSTAARHTEPIGEIRQWQTIGQSFVAEYNGLYRVELSLADYGHRNTGPVLFWLFPFHGSPDILAQGSFPAEAIRGDVVYGLEFPPQPASAGRAYYLELEAPGASPGNAITAYLRPDGPYTPGSAYWAGQPQPGDLVFSLYYRVSPLERLEIWFEQVTANKPGVWGQTGLYVGSLAAYLGLLAGLAWLLQQALPLTTEPPAEAGPEEPSETR